jgi:tape measure domain-containing protein
MNGGAKFPIDITAPTAHLRRDLERGAEKPIEKVGQQADRTKAKITAMGAATTRSASTSAVAMGRQSAATSATSVATTRYAGAATVAARSTAAMGTASAATTTRLAAQSVATKALSVATGAMGAAAKTAAVGLAAGTVALGLLGGSALQASMSVDRIVRSLTVGVGSAAAAAKEYEWLRQETRRLGVELEGSAAAYSRFVASSQGTAIAGEQTRKIFSGVASAATVLGLTAEDTRGVLKALTDMISKGSVQAEELKGQLGDRLPKAFQLAASAMGKTTADLNKMLERGEVTAEVLLPRLADELLKTFGPQVDKAAESTQASLANLSTAIFEARAAIGNELSPSVRDLTKHLNRLASDPQSIKFFGDLGKMMAGVVGVVVDLIEHWQILKSAILLSAADIIEGVGGMSAEFLDFGTTVLDVEAGILGAMQEIANATGQQWLAVALAPARKGAEELRDEWEKWANYTRFYSEKVAQGYRIAGDAQTDLKTKTEEATTATTNLGESLGPAGLSGNLETTSTKVEKLTAKIAGLKAAIIEARAVTGGIDYGLVQVPATAPNVGALLDSGEFETTTDEIFENFLDGWRETNDEVQRIWVDTGDRIEERFVAITTATDRWGEALAGISAAFQQMDSDLGNLLSGLFDVIAAYRELRAAEASGDQGRIRAARGQMSQATGGYAGMAAQYVAYNTGWAGGGMSQFGGQMGGNYSREGMEMGGKIWPGWGHVIGFVVGSLVRSGADSMRVATEEGELVIQKAEGGLKDLAQQISESLRGFFGDLENMLGQSIDLAGLDIFVRENRVVVRARGLMQVFRDLDEALAWGVEQVLKANATAAGLGDNMRALFEHFGGIDASGSFEELSAAINLAQALDDLAANAGPAAQAIHDLNLLHAEEMDIARRYGLPLAGVIRLHEERLTQLRRETEMMRLSILGIGDWLGAVQDFERAVHDINQGLVESEQAQRDQLAALEANLAALQAQQSATTSATGSAGQMAGQMIQAGLKAELLGGGLGQISQGFADTLRGAGDLTREIARTEEEIAALKESLANLPEAIDPQGIADAYTAAGAQLFGELYNMLDRIAGLEMDTAAGREADLALYMLQLAALYQQALAFQDAMRAAGISLAWLEGIIERIPGILEGLESGALQLEAPGGGGGGRRRETRALFAEQADAARAALSGLGEQAMAARTAVTSLEEEIAEFRRAGVSAADAAAYLADSLALLERDLLAPFREIVTAAGETQLETDFRQLGTRYADALAAAAALGSAEGAGVIGQAFGIEVRDAMLSAMGDVADAEGLAELRATWDAFLSADLPAALRTGLEMVAADVVAAFGEVVLPETATDELRARLDESLEGLRAMTAQLGPTTTQLIEITGQFAQLRRDTVAAGYGTRELVDRISELARLEAAAINLLGRQHLGRVFGELAQYGAMTPELVALQQQLTVSQLELAKAEALVATTSVWAAGGLQDLGMSLAELLGIITEGYDVAIANVRRVAPRGFAPPRDGGVSPAAEPVRDFLAELEGLLRPFEELALSPLERDLSRIFRQFEEISDLLAEMGASEELWARVAAARQLALQDLWDRATAGLRSTYEEMQTTSPLLSGAERHGMARSRFLALAEAARGGDITAASQLGEALQAYRAASLSYHGGGAQGLTEWREMMAIAESVLGANPLLAEDIADPMVAVVNQSNTYLAQIVGLLGGRPPAPPPLRGGPPPGRAPVGYDDAAIRALHQEVAALRRERAEDARKGRQQAQALSSAEVAQGAEVAARVEDVREEVERARDQIEELSLQDGAGSA